MPIYAYRCRSCGLQFERYQSFTDLALKLCPDCRKKTLRRIISLVGIAFKGPGFYSTDNRPRSSTASSAPAQKESRQRTHKDNAPGKNGGAASGKTD